MWVQLSVRRHTLDLLRVIRLKSAVLDAGGARPEMCAEIGDPVWRSKERGRLCVKAALQGSSHLSKGGLWCLGLLIWQSAKPTRKNAKDLIDVLVLQAGVCVHINVGSQSCRVLHSSCRRKCAANMRRMWRRLHTVCPTIKNEKKTSVV